MAVQVPGFAANGSIAFTTTGFQTFPYGTTVLVIYLTSTLTDGQARSLVMSGASTTSDDIDVVNVYDSTYLPGTWNSVTATDIKGSTSIPKNTWSVVAITKDTGTVFPRAHVLNMSSGGWAHGNASAVEADASNTGQTVYAVNGTSNTQFTGIDGHIAAAGSWYRRALSDSEIERLAAGSWNKYSPDVLVELKSGRAPLAVGPLDHGRQRMPTLLFGSAILRSAIGDPPGFRFSLMGRRR